MKELSDFYQEYDERYILSDRDGEPPQDINEEIIKRLFREAQNAKDSNTELTMENVEVKIENEELTDENQSLKAEIKKVKGRVEAF